MLTTRKCEVGADAGKWYTVVIERQGIRRVGYCALACPGHNSSVEALAHHFLLFADLSLPGFVVLYHDRPLHRSAGCFDWE